MSKIIITDRRTGGTKGQRNQLARLQRFCKKHDVVLDAQLRSETITHLEEFIADPDTDTKTFGNGKLTRHTVCDLGIKGKWITFGKPQARSLLADLQDGKHSSAK
jgi:hypothetical protein